MGKLDILFVVPAMMPKMKEESIGTLILAKKAQLTGYKSEIVRYWDVKISPKVDYYSFRTNIIRYILNKQPSIVSFYCRCEEYHICIDLSIGIKQLAPTTVVSFGGPQAELVAYETISRFNSIDYVCCSEGENTIVPFLDCILKSETYNTRQSVPGLVYRDNDGHVVRNQLPCLLPDAYVRDFTYYDLLPQDMIDNCDSMPIDVGRGCPFSCTYCSTKTFWKQKFRLRKIENTIDEIEYLYAAYRIDRFDFMHDLFTVNKERVIAFCKELSKRNLNIKWGCDSRIDTIDESLIDQMIDSGLTQIFFGIETGSERMQQLINKRLNLTHCKRIIEHCLNMGIKVTVSFIYGFPEETEDDLSCTLKMIVELQNMGCNVLTNLCHIMNGTELFIKYQNQLFLDEHTAYNHCIPALHDLLELIRNNHIMFANFCDFPEPNRDKMKYIDAYRYTLQYAYLHMPQEHAFLKSTNYASFKMYQDFCIANKDVFIHTIPASNGDVTTIRRTFKYTSPNLYKLMIHNLISHIKQQSA